jgi:hypothetical protein
VADRGPCAALPVPRIDSAVPASAAQNSCVSMTLYGANLVPEMRLSFVGGTGPLPSARNTRFDPAGNYLQAEVCVPRAKGGKKPSLGHDPVWDALLSSSYAATPQRHEPTSSRLRRKRTQRREESGSGRRSHPVG